ncbi:MAG TPA: acyl-CoA dehydrogenase family protein [Mycobacteriales bacterium]|jgi:alkylation response protein AidB-like acyl-CoA dehydrogenase|nr:acyl-CoA dehydrogenase family protein [Mycobacteriales bacterium]
MDFDFTTAEQEFRTEVRRWLADHLTDEIRDLGEDWDKTELRLAWEKELGQAGWIGLSWPAQYGGRGATIIEQLIFAEEYARAGAPPRAPFGEGLLGPTLIALGTEAQRQRFLPAILRGEQQWCQGFSEPEAGSDLAGVRTKARLEGDEWIIDGQKIWTSQAMEADWIFVLARTNPDVPKHKGLSFILVPMDQPGVEVRPIRNLTGSSEFNEVYFDGARTGSDLVVNGVDGGWAVAMATLGFERGTAFLGQQVRFAEELDRLVGLVQEQGRAGEPRLRQQLAALYAELQIMKYSGFRTLTQVLRTGTPGPESSVGKLFWSQWAQRLGELELDVLGPAGQVVGADYELSGMQNFALFARAHTIYAGSSEVQRNIVSERVLGMPRDPVG